MYYINIFFEGFFIGLISFCLIIIFDILNINTVKEINAKLYIQAIYHNIINLLIISPIVYYYIIKYFSNFEKLTIEKEIFDILFILSIQSILYHYIHKMIHTPLFYNIHKFHHQFNKYVIPMSANAVSIYEFLFAYLLPIIIPIICINADSISINISIVIISFNNILIHSPIFKNISKYLPKIFVSTNKHLIHHKYSNKNYSAPTIDYNYLFNI